MLTSMQLQRQAAVRRLQHGFKPALKLTHVAGTDRRTHLTVRAGGDQQGDDSIESMFAKELQRRGLGSGGSSSKDVDFSGAKSQDPFASTSTSSSRSPSATKATASESLPFEDGGNQRQRSMDMVTEGLEGLPGRASVLLQLGGSVFLAFVPFIVLVSVLFGGVYSLFGESFVHGGRADSGPPAYVDPDVLLSEQTVDRYIPFQ